RQHHSFRQLERTRHRLMTRHISRCSGVGCVRLSSCYSVNYLESSPDGQFPLPVFAERLN
ncbi:hypothetical protein, partial [Klebsiella michiganensis]|uniref:hypothetical protein n=1 Tax=Klebsiella michiganensis TaxID=1134687 RepID=UPI001F4BAB58